VIYSAAKIHYSGNDTLISIHHLAKILLLVCIIITPLLVSTKSISQQHVSGVTLGPWQETANFVDEGHRSHPLPSFAVGSYYYVHTKTNEGARDRIVYYAGQRADGSLTPWAVALYDHGGGPQGYTAVAIENTAYHFRNGHIGQYVIEQGTGWMPKIRLLENSAVHEPFSGNKYMWDTAVHIPSATGDSYIYHLGGFDMTSHRYDTDDMHRTTTPIAQENAYFKRLRGIDAPTKNPNKATFYRKSEMNGDGYIYMGDRNSSKIYRTEINEGIEDSPEAWIDSGEFPRGNDNHLGDMFVIEDSLFVIRGSKVFRAAINAIDGSLSSWDDSPPDLPEAQIDVNWHSGNTEGASYGIIGDYVYVTGSKKVYYSKINIPNYKTFLARIQ